MIRWSAVGLVLATATLAAASEQFPDGLFVRSANAPIELVVFADRIRNGQMRFSNGGLEDVPVVDTVQGVLSSLPNWRPTGVWLSTMAVFRDEFAERRQLPFAVRPRSIYAIELRIRDLETPEGVQRMISSVRSSAGNPAILFVTLDSNGVTRDYVVQIGGDKR